MPAKTQNLRRWVAAAGIASVILVGMAYFHARHRVQNALKQVPEKIGIEVQQSAKGFTVSKSYQGRTLFKIEAGKAVQFKEGGRGELHDVEITVYGRDSSRFDRIRGKDFEYDPRSGDVLGKGEVQIDLEANPQGMGSPDQSLPKNLKNQIHLTTTDLMFNQKTGDAQSNGEVHFDLPQGSGSAHGLHYVSKENLLSLDSQVEVSTGGFSAITITADSATLRKIPRVLTLENPHLREAAYRAQAKNATLFLSEENRLERVLAEGKVMISSSDAAGANVASNELELFVNPEANTLRQVILTGDVHFEKGGRNDTSADAGHAVFNFGASNVLKNVRADQGVTLISKSSVSRYSTGKSVAISAINPSQLPNPAKSEDFELTAPAINFLVRNGKLLRQAETVGQPRIVISQGGDLGQTVITAGKFVAGFDSQGEISTLNGAPDARIVTKTPGKPDRVSTSQTLLASFQPGIGLTGFVQQGSFRYSDGKLTAWSDTARYTSADQMLSLAGGPRVEESNMTTTAKSLRINRVNGQAYAENDVKSTYIPSNSRAGMAPPAPPSPIHVTAGAMRATRAPELAVYSGNVRLWQDADAIEAPLMEFDGNHRSIVAESSEHQRVRTSLVQLDKHGAVTPVTITSDRLSYADGDREAHFAGKVLAISAEMTLQTGKMDCFLRPADKSSTAGSLEKIVASGNVTVTQVGRRATGDRLVYTAADDKFVMTGGPPSIFDAEQGKITGVSLTLFGRDGRVLVEGNNNSPAVTQTRVAR